MDGDVKILIPKPGKIQHLFLLVMFMDNLKHSVKSQ